jgi:hypothetical protein
MNFGSLHIATLWRLTRAGVTCQGIVLEGPGGARLIVVEGERIVHWRSFALISHLRAAAGAMLKARRQAGWIASPREA